MKKQYRLRDYEIKIGQLQPGKKNAITDVKGVQVGHSTIREGACLLYTSDAADE